MISRRTAMSVRTLQAGAVAATASALALAACDGLTGPAQPPGTPDPAGTAVVTATATLSSTVPTAAVTATATLSATATVTPTTTVEPSATATATLTPTPTLANLPYAARGARFTAGDTRVWGLQFGLEFEPQRYLEYVTRELPRAREHGLSSVRTTVRWDRIEPANTTVDAFDWRESDRKLGDYSRAGFDMIVQIVAYPAWATEWQCGGSLRPGMEAEWRELVRAVVARYSQAPYRVAAWEIGNEVDGEAVVRPDDHARPPEWGRGEPTTPEGGCWGGRAAAYAEFLRMAYEEAKAVHPDIPVTLGGLAYADVNGWFDVRFLDDLFAAGGGAHVDFVGYHWFSNLRDVFPTEPTGPEKHARIAETMRRHGVAKPIWLTETYRFAVTARPETRAEQIDFLTKELVETLARGDIARVYWYGWVDFPPSYSDTERGLVTYRYEPKPALPALPYVVRYTQGVAEDISTDRVTAFRFRVPRGTGETVVAWSRDGRPAPLAIPARTNRPAAVTTFPKEMLMAGRCCGRTQVVPAGGAYAFDVTGDAAFVAIDREP